MLCASLTVSNCFIFNVNPHITYQKEKLIYSVILMTILHVDAFKLQLWMLLIWIFILILNLKLSNSLVPGWSWWSECSSSADDMEDSCSRHPLWRGKGRDRLQPKGPEHQWVGTSNSGFHPKDSWSHWHSERCSCPWYGNQCSGIDFTILTFCPFFL